MKAAEIRAMQDENHRLRVALDRAISDRIGAIQGRDYAVKEAVTAAVSRAYDSGYADGYQAGAFDALCKVSPGHEKAVALAHGTLQGIQK